MADRSRELDVQWWPREVRRRFESYLGTSFFFKDQCLRSSFQAALEEADLLKGRIRSAPFAPRTSNR